MVIYEKATKQIRYTSYNNHNSVFILINIVVSNGNNRTI